MGSAATGTTCEDVKRRLAATVLTLPTTPIDSARPGEVDLLDPNVAPATFDRLTVSAEVLAQQPTTADFADMGARRIAICRIRAAAVQRVTLVENSTSIARLSTAASPDFARCSQTFGIQDSWYSADFDR